MNNGKSDSPNIIAAAILTAQAANQQAEQKRQAQLQDQLAMLKRSAKPYLEKLAEAGAEIEEGGYGTQNEGKQIGYLEYPISLPGFARFWLVCQPYGTDAIQMYWQNHSQGNRDYHHASHRMIQVTDQPGFGNFLLERQEKYQKQEAERQQKQAQNRQKEAEELVRRLTNWRLGGFPETEAAAGDVITAVSLLSQAHDLEMLRQEWQKQLQEMQQFRADQEAERLAGIEQKRLYAEKLAEFKTAWQRYVAARERIWVVNRARLAPLQEKYNQPFEVYELCYALYVPALDEDGPYAEKESCDCLWPYLDGFHREIGRNGVIRPYRYSDSHIYKIGKEREVQPVSYKNAGRYQLMDLLGEDVALRYTPGTDPEEIAAAVQQTFEPIPDEPAPDPMLSYSDVQKIKRGQEPDEDIPF